MAAGTPGETPTDGFTQRDLEKTQVTTEGATEPLSWAVPRGNPARDCYGFADPDAARGEEFVALLRPGWGQ